MIKKLGVEYSEKYLYEFFKSLNQKQKKNIGLMGGWAVHLFLKKLEVSHIGSRDIDIFFNPREINFKDLITKVESLGFKPHSTFRWAKYVQLSTKKELSEDKSKDIPIYDLFTVYFDIACPKKVDKRIMHLSILEDVFKKEYELVKFKGQEIIIPSSKILVQIKLESVLGRTDKFKKEKDIADLFALLKYGDSNWEIKKGKRFRLKELDRKIIERFQKELDKFIRDGTIVNSSNMIRVGVEPVINLFKKM